MKLGTPLDEGIFLYRENRFLAWVLNSSAKLACFLPNPGRLEELLIPGVKVLLRHNARKGKTVFDLIGVYLNNSLISIDSRVPNKLIFEALKNKELEDFSGYDEVIQEYKFGCSKLDFYLKGRNIHSLVEVKSCTLVKEATALFPDAPTVRGRRHLKDLIEARRKGFGASIIFVIQRDDANNFTPNYALDPIFGNLLHAATQAGVGIYAYICTVMEREIKLDQKVPVIL
jgi:sugar fermentation stimulation protein A